MIPEEISDLRAEMGLLRDEFAAALRVIRTQGKAIQELSGFIARIAEIVLVLTEDYRARKQGN